MLSITTKGKLSYAPRFLLVAKEIKIITISRKISFTNYGSFISFIEDVMEYH